MSEKVIISYGDSIVRQSDLTLLNSGNWLNDAILAFWLDYLQLSLFPGDTQVLFVGPQVRKA